MNRPSSKTILITHVHSTQNAGDLALLECCLSQLSLAFPGAKFILLANWPEEAYFSGLTGIKTSASPAAICGTMRGEPLVRQFFRLAVGFLSAILYAAFHPAGGIPKPWRELFTLYAQADLVVGVSGNQFYSTGKWGWPFPVTALPVALALLFKKPFFTMPQTIGPLRRSWERKLLAYLYQGAKLVLLRDAASLAVAAGIGLPAERYQFNYDPAFSFPAAGHAEAARILDKYGCNPTAPSVGVTILANMGRSLAPGMIEAYYRMMVDLINKITGEFNARVYIFNQVVGPTRFEDDRIGAQKVKSLLAENPDVVVVDEVLTPAQLKACYGLMNLFVPTRLHSGIFALSMGVPCIFIGYLSKTAGVLRQIGLEDWCVEIGDMQLDSLWRQVEKAWHEQETRRAYLKRILPDIIQQSEISGIKIAQAYNDNQ